MNIEKLKAAAIAANQAWMDEPYEIEPALVLELIERLEAAEKQYSELIYAVKRKFPDETRHQTALRYIKTAEAPSYTNASVKEQGK